MIAATCHCGALQLEIAEAPATVTECNCSICRRMGVLWAYYVPAAVRVVPASGGTNVYMWDDKTIQFHRCKVCGNVTHWSPVDPALQRMGVNARLMDPAVLAAARVRHLDGAGTERYVDDD